MMTTSTISRTTTIVHTATYLTDAIFGTMSTLLEHLGLDALTLAREWENTYAPAIRAWIQERTLKEVVLECTTPAGVKQRFDFAVDYTDGGGGFRNRMQVLSGYYGKIASLPARTTWRIVCTYYPGRTPQPGWSATTLDAGVGPSMSLGTLARAPHAQVSLKTYGQ